MCIWLWMNHATSIINGTSRNEIVDTTMNTNGQQGEAGTFQDQQYQPPAIKLEWCNQVRQCKTGLRDRRIDGAVFRVIDALQHRP